MKLNFLNSIFRVNYFFFFDLLRLLSILFTHLFCIHCEKQKFLKNKENICLTESNQLIGLRSFDLVVCKMINHIHLWLHRDTHR
jgi:hypothetical protein